MRIRFFFLHSFSPRWLAGEMTEARGGGPMFPRLHISDAADKRGPRAPPRNKMALYEQLSVPSAAAAAAAAAAPLRPSSVAPALSSSAAPPLSSVRHVGHRQLSGASELVAENTSLYQHETLTRNNSVAKVVNEDDDFGVPTFTKVASCSRKGACNFIQKSVRFSSNTVHNPSSSEHRNIRSNEQNEMVASHQEIVESRYGLSHAVSGFSNRENKASSKEVIQNLHDTRVEGFAESWDNGYSKSSRCLNQEHAVGNGTVSKGRSGSCSGSPHANFNGSTNVDGDAAGGNDDGHELSETSIVDSGSCGLEISPDDVLAVIGPKHFWKARRAIINQQRVFALQVFELHRLITVQKLIAASPDLLSDDNIYTRKSEQKVPNTNILLKNNARMEAQHAQQTDEHLKPTKNSNFATAEAGTDPPTSCEDHQINEHQKPTPVPVPDNMRNLWCFQQPSNQWLIPVMSPSEGLIYKPITAPLLSSSGFMAPVYGNYSSPLGMPPMGYCNPFTASADHATGSTSLNPYGSALSKSQEDHSYTTCKKSNKGKDNQSYITQDTSAPTSEVLSRSVRANQVNKESELQVSMANSCCTRNQEGQAMSTLNESTKPSQSRDKDQLIRVIKVTPHNPKSATESAARIFRSIQQERQKFDL